jgi:hypothetical protein
MLTFSRTLCGRTQWISWKGETLLRGLIEFI